MHLSRGKREGKLSFGKGLSKRNFLKPFPFTGGKLLWDLTEGLKSPWKHPLRNRAFITLQVLGDTSSAGNGFVFNKFCFHFLHAFFDTGHLIFFPPTFFFRFPSSRFSRNGRGFLLFGAQTLPTRFCRTSFRRVCYFPPPLFLFPKQRVSSPPFLKLSPLIILGDLGYPLLFLPTFRAKQVFVSPPSCEGRCGGATPSFGDALFCGADKFFFLRGAKAVSLKTPPCMCLYRLRAPPPRPAVFLRHTLLLRLCGVLHRLVYLNSPPSSCFGGAPLSHRTPVCFFFNPPLVVLSWGGARLSFILFFADTLGDKWSLPPAVFTNKGGGNSHRPAGFFVVFHTRRVGPSPSIF